MEYQSLYRKYRPKDFNSVVGQDVVLKILKNAITQQKISHAYLFAGPRGTGKTSIARIMAKAINCEFPENGNPCDKCKSCETANQKENIDILEIDAASNNGVNEIRELRNKINLMPGILNYKVYIIDEVHMLSTGAFPALLKTLEEPPKHAIFILATTELHDVPSTILSRCQLMEFKKISNDNLKKKLLEISTGESINIDESALDEICKTVDGGMRDAIGILEKVSLYTTETITEEDIRQITGSISEEKIKELVELINNSDIEKLINKIDQYYNSGIDLIRLAAEVIRYLRDEIFERKNIDSNKISNSIEILNNAINKMRLSTNPKPLLEIALLNLCNSVGNISNLQIENNKEESEKKQVLQKQIKEEPPQKIEAPNELDEYREIKAIRVNNTLAEANKNSIIKIREKWSLLQEEAFNTEYGSYARILFDDAKPVAASEEYLILTFKIESLAKQCNDAMKKIENLIIKSLNSQHKIICLSEEEWHIHTEDYKKNKGKYTYIKEKEREEKKETSKENDTSNETEKSITEKALELFGEI